MSKAVAKHDIKQHHNCFIVYFIAPTWRSRSHQNNPIKTMTHCDLTCRVCLSVVALNAKPTL